MTESAPQFRARTVGCLELDGGHSISIDHVFTLETCEEGHQDEGFVGLAVDTGSQVTTLLAPEEALLLADRLTRAAQLALESYEDLPDAEREYRRHRGNGDLS